MTPAQRRYDSISSIPMFVVAMIWLVSTFFTWVPSLQETYRREGVTLSLITWLIFAVDFTIRFVLDPDKRHFLKRNWPLALALAFPPLRIILVIAAVVRLTRDRNALAKMVGLYALYAVLFVVVFGSLSTLIFEINAPGANIVSFGDAVWWAFVTVTTVGYGDFTPVTVGGRFVAVLIMFTGAAAVGAVTAAVASRFISSANTASAAASSKAGNAPKATTAGSTQVSQQPLDHHPSPAVSSPSPPADREERALDDLATQVMQLREHIAALTERLDAAATRGERGE